MNYRMLPIAFILSCCFTVHILGSSAKSVTIEQVGLIRQITSNKKGFRLC